MSDSSRKSDSAAGSKVSYPDKIVFVLLCAMPVLATVAFGAVDVWALGVNAFFVGLIAVFWTADAWLKKDFRFGTNSLQIPLAGLFLIGLIQLLPLRSLDLPAQIISIPAVNSLSLAPYATRLAIVQLVVYLIFFAAAQTFINDKNRLRKIVVLIVGFGSLMAFYGILQQLASLTAIYGLRPSSQAVPFASFVNRHHFAALMEMTIGLTLGLLFGKATGGNKRIFLLIAAIIMGIALVFTSSRGGIVSLLVVVGFIVAANLRLKPNEKDGEQSATTGNWRRNAVYIGGGLLIVLVLFGSALLLGGDESLLRGVGLTNQADASGGRFHFWQIAWRIFLDHPIIGAGLDAFGTAFPRYDSWNGTYRVEQAHNDYLQILADAGIAGFACVAAFIYLLFKKSRTVVSEASDRFGRGAGIGALAGCSGILVHSFFDFPLRTPANALFFLVLTVIATNVLNPPKVSRRRHSR